MEIVLRATFIFFFLWFLTRIMGKRELSQLSAFELVLLVVTGDLVQQGVTQEDYSMTGAVLAVGTMGFWTLALAALAFRTSGARAVIEGRPVVVIREGHPMVEVMRLERVTLDELKGAARARGIADLRDIQIGLLEPDGDFSFITTPSTPDPDPPPDRPVR